MKSGVGDNVISNVELSESFQVFYPDGTVSVTTGGQTTIQEFQEVVQEATKEGFDIHCKMSVVSEAVTDYKDNALLHASLLQFPYGKGGFNDKRITVKRVIGDVPDIIAYTTYLSKQSLSQFQMELFVLQIYNMQMKFKMMTTAMWKVRDKHFADYISTEISTHDVDEAIEEKRYGARTHRANAFLGAIDAVCKAIPHTNEAAKIARRDIETMQHHFGCPTYFLTITPDDDNHFLIQVFSQITLSPTKNIDEMTDDEIFQLSKSKTELRIKFPGVSAYFFEVMIDIVLTDVIGWDKQNNCPTTTTGGVFGKISALTISVEEQGRRHITCTHSYMGRVSKYNANTTIH